MARSSSSPATTSGCSGVTGPDSPVRSYLRTRGEGGRSSVRRVDPEHPAEAGTLVPVFEVDQGRRRVRGGVLGAEDGVAAAVLEPADDRPVVDPGDDHLA